MRRLILSLACLCFCLTPKGADAQADLVVPIDDVVSRVVVRASASSGSADLGGLRPGEQAELLGSVPRWYRVRLADGTEGFVSKRWTRVVSVVDGVSFSIDVVDVGTGLGVLVRGEDFTLIYDGGSNDDLARGNGNRMLAYLQAVAPDLTVIDHIVLSHPHRDHVELLPDLFDAYEVRRVWDSGRLHDICGYRAFITAVRHEPGVSYHSAAQDFGTREFAFGPRQCYGQPLPAEVIALPHGSRINEFPVPLGQDASMTFLHADGAQHSSPNENSLAVRLDLGTTRVLFMGDAEAGGRQDPHVPPSLSSIEGVLLACCLAELAADILVVGHHGSKTSSRRAFLDAVGPSTFVVSSGPMRYGTVVLPDQEVIDELLTRGEVFRTDLNDDTCRQNPDKIGPPADGRPGGCDNVQIQVPPVGDIQVEYWPARP